MAAPLSTTGAPTSRKVLRTSSLVAWSVTVTGLLVLGFVAFVLLGSKVQANRAQDVLYGRIVDELGLATAPINGVIRAGTPIGVLEIPRLGLRQALIQGSSAEQTAKGPGLKSDTAFPGQAGNSFVVGRRASFGAPFRDLGRLQVDDEIKVVTGQGTSTFKVDLVRFSDSAKTELSNVASRLTLVTSDPAFTPTRQVVATAVLVSHTSDLGETELTTTPYPTSTTPVGRLGEKPGEHTLDNAIVVLLWTQALLAIVYLVTRLGLRFGKRALWIGATPVLFAVVWNVFEGVAALLPNTL
jgi:sortase A